MVISQELFDLLQTALQYSRITHGAFDITYASVGYMYDFHAHKRPDAAQIKAALPAIGYQHIVLNPARHTVYFTRPGVRIDLGGIAKGYSVDRGIAILQARGITNALVNAGGTAASSAIGAGVHGWSVFSIRIDPMRSSPAFL